MPGFRQFLFFLAFFAFGLFSVLAKLDDDNAGQPSLPTVTASSDTTITHAVVPPPGFFVPAGAAKLAMIFGGILLGLLVLLISIGIVMCCRKSSNKQ